MKKLKALSALLVAAVLTLGSLSVVFAEEKAYVDLEVTAKSFYNLRYAEIGTYPVITGYKDLNAEILKDLEEAFELATDKFFMDSMSSSNVFAVSYAVTNENQFAKIDVTYAYQLTAIKMGPFQVVKTYFVDKALAKGITKAEYDAGIEAQKAKPEEDEAAEDKSDDKVEEVILVPIRSYAEGLGYTVGWDNETKTVILTKGDARITVKVGVNEYLVDNQIVQLEVAPTNQNGSVYVPVSFFVKSLGAVFSVDTEGNIVISAPQAKAEQ